MLNFLKTASVALAIISFSGNVGAMEQDDLSPIVYEMSQEEQPKIFDRNEAEKIEMQRQFDLDMKEEKEQEKLLLSAVDRLTNDLQIEQIKVEELTEQNNRKMQHKEEKIFFPQKPLNLRKIDMNDNLRIQQKECELFLIIQERDEQLENANKRIENERFEKQKIANTAIRLHQQSMENKQQIKEKDQQLAQEGLEILGLKMLNEQQSEVIKEKDKQLDEKDEQFAKEHQARVKSDKENQALKKQNHQQAEQLEKEHMENLELKKRIAYLESQIKGGK